MALLELENVTKIYRKGVTASKVMAVQGLSFSLQESGIVGFVGPNGAGKTTSVKMILGLVRPTAGTIRVLGKDWSDPTCRRRLAFVSEQPYFYGHLTSLETLRFIGKLRGQRGRTLNEDVGRVLHTTGLAESARRKVGELSKGMQQRLNMAQALLGDPDLFIFDEPMSGLDPPGRSLFRRIFGQLRDSGKSIFFSTHILEDVEVLCPRVIVLARGECRYDGSVEKLLADGFEGTELRVHQLPGGLRADLETIGCTITDIPADSVHIFVPAGEDIHTVQRRLVSSGVYAESITQRRKSLETLLYSELGSN